MKPRRVPIMVDEVLNLEYRSVISEFKSFKAVKFKKKLDVNPNEKQINCK